MLQEQEIPKSELTMTSDCFIMREDREGKTQKKREREERGERESVTCSILMLNSPSNDEAAT